MKEDSFDEFEPRLRGRTQKRRRPPQVRRDDDVVACDLGFRPSYKARREDRGERQWIIDALGDSYQDKLIDDVLRLVRGGKEATVYVCRAHPSAGVPLLAAKIYRPRK